MDCSFCYLSKEERSDNNKINLKVLDVMLECIDTRWDIDHIDIYGGEIALLSPEYLKDLFYMTRWYTNGNTNSKWCTGNPKGNVNIITNFLKFNPAIMEDENLDISVSYDFKGREKSTIVLNNMINSDRDINVLMLGTNEVLSVPTDFVVSTFNFLKRVRCVEIKPYSTNQCNEEAVKDGDFERFVKEISSSKKKKFEFTNETWARDCINGKYNAYSDNHLYITPNAEYAVLDFDENDNEYFRIMETLDDYEDWTEQEKIKVQSLPHCSNCKYLGSCMTEHYKTACSGYPNLLDWYSQTS